MSRTRRYNPSDLNIARLFLAVREHRTGNPPLDKIGEIKALLNRVQNINDVDFNDSGNTLLHVAVSNKHRAIIDLLLKEGAKIQPNNFGKTPVSIAQDLESEDIVLQLKAVTSKRKNTGENRPEVDLSKKLRISSMQGPKETKEENIDNKYPASGLKHTLHGSIYQLKLLMLFLKRGLDQGYSFRLATEWDDAEKFDDLVFMYNDSRGKNYRFLQAKHKLDEKMVNLI